MLRMDRIHVVRHKLEVEGKSQREVARELGHSRNTVAKFAASPAPERTPYTPRGKPVLEAVQPRIDALLADWKQNTTRKQRITATTLHKALVADGFKVGVTTVRDYLRELKRQKREVYVPLQWDPGDAAQVDFFEATVRVAGELRKVWLFVMRLVYSGHDFVWLYERCDQLCFLDGHVRAFAHFAAVPRRVIYDNLKPAVAKVVLPERELSLRFVALRDHYLFEACFARPGEGHDKGSVEARGKGIRISHMVPIPSGATLGDLSEKLLNDVTEQGRTRHDRDRDHETAEQRFRRELPLMHCLPRQPFEARLRVHTTVSSTSRVHVAGAWYSVPTRWHALDVVAYVGVDAVTIRCGDEEVSAPRQPFGGSYVQQRHYLPELARKPQAVRQNALLLTEELGAPFPDLWRLLVDWHGPRDAARRMARILEMMLAEGESVVRERVRRAIETDTVDRLLLTQKRQPKEVVAVPNGLEAYEIEESSAATYDALLGGASHG